MSIVTTTNWTLEVDLGTGYCTVRQYRTKTEVLGDEATHKDTEQMGWHRFSLEDLPNYIRERKIAEFTCEDDMQWLLQAPVY